MDYWKALLLGYLAYLLYFLLWNNSMFATTDSTGLNSSEAASDDTYLKSILEKLELLTDVVHWEAYRKHLPTAAVTQQRKVWKQLKIEAEIAEELLEVKAAAQKAAECIAACPVAHVEHNRQRGVTLHMIPFMQLKVQFTKSLEDLDRYVRTRAPNYPAVVDSVFSQRVTVGNHKIPVALTRTTCVFADTELYEAFGYQKLRSLSLEEPVNNPTSDMDNKLKEQVFLDTIDLHLSYFGISLLNYLPLPFRKNSYESSYGQKRTEYNYRIDHVTYILGKETFDHQLNAALMNTNELNHLDSRYFDNDARKNYLHVNDEVVEYETCRYLDELREGTSWPLRQSLTNAWLREADFVCYVPSSDRLSIQWI